MPWVPAAIGAVGAIGGGLLASKGAGGGGGGDKYGTDAKYNILKYLLGMGRDTPSLFTSPVEQYPGTTVPPMNQFLQGYMDQAGGYLPGGQRAGQVNTIAEKALSLQPAMSDADFSRIENTWDQQFYRPAMNQFTRETLPAIGEKYSSMGAFNSGGRKRAEIGAAGDMMTNLQGIRAGMMQDEYWRQQNAAENRLDRATSPAFMDFLKFPMDVNVGAGMVQQERDQTGLNEQYQRWLETQPYNNPWWSHVMALQGGPAPADRGNPYQQNIGNMMAQTGGTILGQAMSGWLNKSYGSQYGGHPDNVRNSSSNPYYYWR